MKKLFTVLLLLLSSSLFAQNMDVSGAGTAEVNGVYVVAGTSEDGKTYYEKDGIYLYSFSGSYWVLSVNLNSGYGDDIYYYASSNASTPDGVTFIVKGSLGNGSFPAANGTALPVELTTFTASVLGKKAELNWQTATEVNNYGFEVERKNVHQISSNIDNWEKIAFVEGHGNSNSPKYYTYLDKTQNLSGKYLYKLKQIDIDGTYEYSEEVEVDFGMPEEFVLDQNYPNPFNPSTKIEFALPITSQVKISVFNTIGEEVAVLLNNTLETGSHSVEFNASKLQSGVYFYRIEAGNYSQIRKMTLVK